MNNDIVSTGKTVEAAVASAARQLGIEPDALKYEVICQPKKGFLGIGEVPAKIRVITEQPRPSAPEKAEKKAKSDKKPEKKPADKTEKQPAEPKPARKAAAVTGKKVPTDLALDFLEGLLANMGVTARLELCDEENGDKLIRITGEEASVLIGHHGDTLDCLQYLVNLAANKKENDQDEREYTRITVDIEGYRSRREATLRSLAHRMANKCLKSGKNVTLEPMSAAERRIIHSEVQNIEGVCTRSVGQESNRRVVISPEKTADRESN